MTKAVIYNKEMLEVIKEDIDYLFGQYGRLNISYEKASKEGTIKQKGFIFAAQIKGITEYLQDCGFNVDDVDVRYKLYKDVSKMIGQKRSNILHLESKGIYCKVKCDNTLGNLQVRIEREV